MTDKKSELPSSKRLTIANSWSAQGSRRLNYDLQILEDYVKLHSISRIVISFQDSQTFEGGLLGEIVDVFR